MARPSPDLTPDRAHRLCKLLLALGHGPTPKATLVRKLKVEERGFFRDLRLIRELGINVASNGRGYVLGTPLEAAFHRLPMPEVKLSLRDAMELSTGQSPAHQRMRREVESILGTFVDRSAVHSRKHPNEM